MTFMGTIAIDAGHQTQRDRLTVFLKGRLDTTTAPKLEAKLRPALADSVKELTLDLAMPDYVSSPGVRVLLSARKIMKHQGEMTVRNVKDNVMDVFEVTGFADLLNRVNRENGGNQTFAVWWPPDSE